MDGESPQDLNPTQRTRNSEGMLGVGGTSVEKSTAAGYQDGVVIPEDIRASNIHMLSRLKLQEQMPWKR